MRDQIDAAIANGRGNLDATQQEIVDQPISTENLSHLRIHGRHHHQSMRLIPMICRRRTSSAADSYGCERRSFVPATGCFVDMVVACVECSRVVYVVDCIAH